MRVEQILGSKGDTVYTVESSDRIRDALDVLVARNIGAVVVSDRGRVAGILSERDIMRRLHAQGASVLDAEVASCMTADPVTCGPDTLIDEVMSTMTERRIRHIPVIADSGLAGVVSIGDVVKFKIEQAEREAAALRDYIAS